MARGLGGSGPDQSHERIAGMGYRLASEQEGLTACWRSSSQVAFTDIRAMKVDAS